MARRPTAEELRALQDQFLRDPGAAAIPLAEGLLALGRPREAIEALAQVVKAAPDRVDARLVLGRSYFQLHQWKEAQAQLVRVVKDDRTSAEGFALLGEVLMRRSDYDRALPVLQHAHNLDPANGSILAMVKRARSHQALDAPAPLPTPIDPEGAGRPRLPGAQPADDDHEFEIPTTLAQSPMLRGQQPAAPVPVQPSIPPLAAPSPSPAPAPAARPARESAPPAPPGVRPRVFAPDKRPDAAKESLRQSAAVGEDYLNNLLTGGLLDLPNVRVSLPDYKVEVGQKWGRSAVKTFIVLFVLLFLGVGSGGAWYFYAEKRKAETIAQYLAKAKADTESGSFEDLKKAVDNAKSALDLDKRDPYSIAVLSQIMGMSAYIYQQVSPSEVELGIETAATQITEPKQPGYRELTIARATATLASLYDGESGEERLKEVRKNLKAHLAENADDHIARWLSGRAMLAAGDRKGAAAAFDQAAARGGGTVLATIDRANMHMDEGDMKKAMELYDEVLKRSPDHPLACIGRSLARSERSMESAEAMADLNVCLASDMGPRIGAYKQLALAYAYYFIEDYDDFIKALGSATGVDEPRFLARVALARILQGKLIDAGNVRANIRWFASDPQPDPLVSLVDAELFYATGSNDEVMKIIDKRDGLRAVKLRGKVYWDQSKFEEAEDEFKSALAIAPDDLESLVYLAAIKMTTSKGSEREAAEDELDKLGRRAKSKLPRHVYGEALLRDGQFAKARDEFVKALTDVSDEAPHPLAYRSHVALAELDARAARAAAEKAPEEADALEKSALEHLNEALKQNPSNLPALDLAGRLLVKRDADKALGFLIAVVDAGSASPYAELSYAELLADSKNEVDKTKSREALVRAKSKGAAAAEIERVAELVGGKPLVIELLGPR